MPERHGSELELDYDEPRSKAAFLGRRRLLKLTGIGILGTTATQAAAASSDLPHRIVFDGSGTSDSADYEFATSESVEPAGDVGAVESTDTVDGASVAGTVQGDQDAYRFSGHLTMLDAAGDLTVSITYADTTPAGPDRLEIVTPSGGSVEYTFTVDGTVEKVFDNGRNSAERNNDTITTDSDGTRTVSGMTGNGYGDAYDVEGDVTAFDPASGEFTLFLNGTETTVAELTGQGDSGSDDTQDDTSDDPEVVGSHVLEIVAPNSVEYTLTTAGEIRKDLDNGRNSAEQDNDVVTQNDDGTWSATGMTGNGYGDTYEFDGEPIEFVTHSGDANLYLDGQDVTAADLAGDTPTTSRLEIVTDDDGAVEYTFLTTDEATKVLDNGTNSAEEDNDTITQNSDGTFTVTGMTGNGYGDAYDYDGQVDEFDPLEGQFALYVDGQQETAYELTGTEPPSDGTDDTTDGSSGSGGTDDTTDGTSGSDGTSGTADGGPIGGGSGYAGTVTKAQADFVVRTVDELSSALASAAPGEVVFVPGDREIDMGSTSLSVPSGVTLASNRGVDDAPGALIHTGAEPTDLFSLAGNARITGLRIRGPWPGDSGGSSDLARAISVFGDGVEIDNNDIWGFSFAGVYFGGGDGHVHHNVLRECNKNGLGYGIATYSGYPLIEYNYFNNNRHSVASDGSHYGYRLHYNHFGPITMKHVIDMHSPGGVRTEIRNNVVEPVTRTYDGNCAEAIDVDGEPDDAVVVENNWFFQTDCTFELDDVSNKIVRNNYYGESAGVTYGDIIPGYSGWRSA